MKHYLQAVRQPAALTLALLLAACGGGGGGVSPTPTPTPTPTPIPSPNCGITIVADATVASGKSAGASALSACTDPISTVTWTQVSGPAVTLAASRSPTVSIETGTTGVVVLRADAVLANGRSTTATTEIKVVPAVTGSFVTVRADHSLRVGTETSVRAWPTLAGGETLTKIVWTQIAGPTVTMNTEDERVMIFKAPNEGIDTALKFRATMTTSGNKVDFDDVIVSIDRQATTPNGYIFQRSARVHPYVANGPYASALARCTYDVGLYFRSDSQNSLCTVGTLPLLQSDAGSGVPSVEQVMARVLVSHDFLGANFEQFLRTQDPHNDFRRLLAGVTSIVIGSHVRPSFYQPATGAIYLDANFLWLTPEQRDVVTEVPDYRSSFSDGLNFTVLGRQVKDNDYVRRSYSSEERVTRPSSDLLVGLGRLLYHELAHAGDFFAPAARMLNSNQSIYLNAVPRLENATLPSDDLARTYPLMSSQMKDLGQVMYIGATATTTQRNYTPTQVGDFFAGDIASDDYAYSINAGSNSREDLAMLFEEFMMSYRHGIQYDVAYTNLYTDGMSSSQLLVAWGQRGRIGLATIKPRVKLVVGKVAPWIDQATVDLLPAPKQLVVGTSWEGSLVLNGAPRPAQFLFSTPAQKSEQVRHDMTSRRHAH